MVQPQSDLDAMAYEQPMPPFYSPSHSGYVQPAYAGPPPAAYDEQYRLDAGDKLRVVVYGQEGLTNTPLGPGDTVLVGERWF